MKAICTRQRWVEGHIAHARSAGSRADAALYRVGVHTGVGVGAGATGVRERRNKSQRLMEEGIDASKKGVSKAYTYASVGNLLQKARQVYHPGRECKDRFAHKYEDHMVLTIDAQSDTKQELLSKTLYSSSRLFVYPGRENRRVQNS